MRQPTVNDMRRAIGFDDGDGARVRSLAAEASSIIPDVVKHFYDQLLSLEEARSAFTGGAEQLARQAVLLRTWLEDLFTEEYDSGYFERRRSVGEVHARLGLAQHLMCSSMELIWRVLNERLRQTKIEDIDAKLHSLHKLLMLELAMMLESYKLHYSEQVREVERSVVEEKLTRAEHLAEIGQLAASLAHEIKNPLAGISGAIQVIRESMSSDDPHQPIITEILSQIGRLDATVKDLLQYARPTPPKSKKVLLDPVVRRVLSLLQEEPALQRVQIRYDGVARDATVYVDEAQVEQLLMNLILNAAHAVGEGGFVDIQVTPKNGNVELVICDQGTGMSVEAQRRAFEPFFTTKAKGTGLGLSICKRIVEAHGGRIALTSVLNKGTTATVLLPADRDAVNTQRDRIESR